MPKSLSQVPPTKFFPVTESSEGFGSLSLANIVVSVSGCLLFLLVLSYEALFK